MKKVDEHLERTKAVVHGMCQGFTADEILDAMQLEAAIYRGHLNGKIVELVLSLITEAKRAQGDLVSGTYLVDNIEVDLHFVTWLASNRMLVRARSIYGDHKIVVEH